MFFIGLILAFAGAILPSRFLLIFGLVVAFLALLLNFAPVDGVHHRVW